MPVAGRRTLCRPRRAARSVYNLGLQHGTASAQNCYRLDLFLCSFGRSCTELIENQLGARSWQLLNHGYLWRVDLFRCSFGRSWAELSENKLWVHSWQLLNHDYLWAWIAPMTPIAVAVAVAVAVAAVAARSRRRGRGRGRCGHCGHCGRGAVAARSR